MMEQIGPYILSLFIGIGLATATGFRVFLPLFFVSLASYFQWIPLQDNWQWLGSFTALLILGIAMLFEILAYYIPFIDNVLDSIAIPLSAVAGTLLFSSQFVESNEILRWGLGVIAGGGTAATISTALSGFRLASSSGTAGLGNSVVSTVENTGATVMSVLAVFLPLLAVIIAIILLYLSIRFGKKIWYRFFPKNSPHRL
ncbi:MAG: DUF4126 domain-containing protein [Sphingobacterium composti]|uniref:DUF4126 domain-containing protein n=1 Tax=Sphingobacterium composti TaxID=363260 RepID=UPI001356EE34|nr:DUF4126 domain-containing protein [Sphingobacterium composti Ten et al. 2007 non Yoo et al. 2007]